MKRFSNPLDNIRIASPCPANWDEMHGDERKRHCAACKLSVYNLSEMTQTEAESFLINAEGRVCVKFYRRADGTILTKNCPVGWQKVKRKVSRTASALFSMCFGIFGGLFAFQIVEADTSNLINEVVVESNEPDLTDNLIPIMGEAEFDVSEQKKTTIRKKSNQMVLGRIENIRRLKDEPVKLWIK